MLDIVRNSSSRGARHLDLVTRLASLATASTAPAAMPMPGLGGSMASYGVYDDALDTMAVMDVEVPAAAAYVSVAYDAGETATMRATSYMRLSTLPIKQQQPQQRAAGAAALGMLTATGGPSSNAGPAAMPVPTASTVTAPSMSAPAPAPAPAAAAKGKVYKEAPGPGAGDGDLPVVVALPIYSDRELRQDLDKAIEELAKVESTRHDSSLGTCLAGPSLHGAV